MQGLKHTVLSFHIHAATTHSADDNVVDTSGHYSYLQPSLHPQKKPHIIIGLRTPAERAVRKATVKVREALFVVAE